MKKIKLVALIMLFATTVSYAQIPNTFTSKSTIKEFFSKHPRFKCPETNVIVKFDYSQSEEYVIYADGEKIGSIDVSLNSEHPQIALLGLPWMPGYGPAPMFLNLNNGKPFCSLIPVEGEENLSFDSRGQLRSGRTGNTTWMSLSLSSGGISFMPMDEQPRPEIFYFIGFE